MTHPSARIPNPGSQDARTRGCTCCMYENEYGRGAAIGSRWSPPIFLLALDCPLHPKGWRGSPCVAAPAPMPSRASRPRVAPTRAELAARAAHRSRARTAAPVVRRVVETTCTEDGCGAPIPYAGRGKPRKKCDRHMPYSTRFSRRHAITRP